NLDTIAVVAPLEGKICMRSDDFEIQDIDIHDFEMKEEEKGTSEALIRGVLKGFVDNGYQIGGFEAYATSDVIVGAGLSSSASFEVLIGTILSGLYNDSKVDMVEIAKISQYAENVYFGKPCGLMDQCACAVGGLITIDFKDVAAPLVKHIDVDFSSFHTSLCITDTKGSHADLTHEYAAVPKEMKDVAAYFGKTVLRDVDESLFIRSLPELRKTLGDRPVLRAMHFFAENERVKDVVEYLENQDFEGFKQGIESSGNSSFKYLQNVYASSDPQNQAVSISLARSEQVLGDKGVCRVHGGGFAGTIQAFVDDDHVEIYRQAMDDLFGEGSCHVLKIRKYGGKKVL
ncbi:MAG: galactokinase, partial [Faecalicoccus sp.]|nr:galactokinase [Faecalicoccus sp.]